MSTMKEEILALVGNCKKQTLDRNAIAKKLNLSKAVELAEFDRAISDQALLIYMVK